MLANVKCLHISSFDSIFWTQYYPKISIFKYKYVAGFEDRLEYNRVWSVCDPTVMRQRYQDLQGLLISDSR